MGYSTTVCILSGKRFSSHSLDSNPAKVTHWFGKHEINCKKINLATCSSRNVAPQVALCNIIVRTYIHDRPIGWINFQFFTD